MLWVILLQDQRTAESNFADYESETAEFLTPFIAMYNQVGEKKIWINFDFRGSYLYMYNNSR